MLRVRKVMPLRAIPEDLSLIVSWSCTGITPGRYLASGSGGSGSGRARAVMSPDQAIQRILELSADAQIERRRASRNSPKFHNLAGAIAAYGKALALLV